VAQKLAKNPIESADQRATFHEVRMVSNGVGMDGIYRIGQYSE
jgi:hypothetical protein